MAKRGRVATPTDLAGMAKCEMETMLKATHGNRMTAESRDRAKAGTKSHERFEREGGGAVDRRCFVASWAVGPDDPATEALRLWRDERLSASRAGRLAIRAYYAASPAAVSLLSGIPGARRAFGAAIRLIASALSKQGGGNG